MIVLTRLYESVRRNIAQRKRQADIRAYIKGGRKPWSRGYKASKFNFIRSVLNDDALIAKFRNTEVLPEGYGYGYDERVVEYPWALSRLLAEESKLLDAGSVLNFPEIVEHPKVSGKQLSILTLAPESNAFWEKGISYHYGDLRELPFRNEWFDEIVSLSTLEHVGMDNRKYRKENTGEQIGLEAKEAAKEIIRVLKPQGRFLVSVPFGKHQILEWDGARFAEQFDSSLLKDLLALFSSCTRVSKFFYKYTEKGWNISTEEQCRGVEYFNVHSADEFDLDNVAAARAVALFEVIK